ncbi:MAG: omptin family outer membrane protease [Spartobacteria bacterium]|nr:omptin family outer membrane protease [Spartobacteria bacterium]
MKGSMIRIGYMALILSLGGCVSWPLTIDNRVPSNIDRDRGRVVSGNGAGFQLFLFIPIRVNSRQSRAWAQLQRRAQDMFGGGAYITDVEMQESWKYAFVGTLYRTSFRAMAYPTHSASTNGVISHSVGHTPSGGVPAATAQPAKLSLETKLDNRNTLKDSGTTSDLADEFEMIDVGSFDQFEMVDVGPLYETSLHTNTFVPRIEPEQFSMWGGIGAWAGDVTYRIGGTVKYADGQELEVNDPLSKLKWPLGVAMLSLGWKSCIFEDRFELFQDLTMNISDPSGKMENSDWPNPDNPNKKYIYSESDTELQAYAIDTGMRIWIMHINLGEQGSINIGSGIGVLFQDMHWKTTSTEQWESGYRESIKFENAGTYTAKMMMLYLVLAGKMNLKSFRLMSELGVAPWMEAKDDDDHKLRYKTSKTDAKGYGIKGRVEGRYYIIEDLFVNAEMKALYYKADGTQKSYFYAGESVGNYHEIDHTIESRQFIASLGIGFAW